MRAPSKRPPAGEGHYLRRWFMFLTVLSIIIIVTWIGSRYFNCGLGRNYKVNRDRTIGTIRDNIKDMEGEEIKDTKTLMNLSENYSRLGVIYLESHDWEQSIAAFEKSISYGKNTPAIYYSLGIAYANRGVDRKSEKDLDRAEGCYRKAVEMYRAFDDARNALAILLFYHRDRRDEALKIMEDVAAHAPKNYQARFTLGRFYYEMDMPEKALSVYEDLHADLDKLPPSEIIDGYKANCSANIQRIMMEAKGKRGG
jgi:tetratricopeptide (TPR) repeat protein